MLSRIAASVNVQGFIDKLLLNILKNMGKSAMQHGIAPHKDMKGINHEPR